MAGIVSIWFLVTYAVLSAVILLGLLYAFVIGLKELRLALKWLLLAAALINIGAVVHTEAILKFGSDNAQIFAFVISHLLLAAGFIVFVIAGNKIHKLAEEIGFGGR